MDDRRGNILAATDEQLMAAHTAGDDAAFAELHRRHERELGRFLRRFVGDAASADDIAQEAFLQVHTSAGAFDVQKSFRPWLFTIAANKARDMLRSRARRRTVSVHLVTDAAGEHTLLENLAAAVEGPTLRLEAGETKDRVAAVIARLPLIYREVLLLAYFHQFPYRHIGEVLGVPLGTVKSRLHVAVKAFAETWQAECGGDPARN